MTATELEFLGELEEELLETAYGSSFESDLLLPELEAHVPAGRCTSVGRRVGRFTCTNAELAAIRAFLGRPAITAPTLKAAVEAAAGRAVSLARRAANALDRSRRNNRTRRIFCEAFGVTPEFVPPWRATLTGVVRWRDLGELVAIRLKDVAKILDGGCIHYFCWGSPAHCPECTRVPPTYFACSSFLGRYIICLGQGFWRAWQSGDTVTTASTLLHEALHIYFRRTVSDTGRSGNANCYERFAVRLQNLFLHPATDAACRAGSCPSPGRHPEMAHEYEEELELEEEAAELELLFAPPAAAGEAPRRHSPHKAAWVRKLIPLLNRYRGEIPLWFLIGWIAFESGGNIKSRTGLNELGYFQIHPDQSRDLRLYERFGKTHEELSTDPDFSIKAGILLVRSLMNRVKQLGYQPGTELFWSLVRWHHWLPRGIKVILAHMRRNGFRASNWEEFRKYVLDHRQEFLRLIPARPRTGWDPAAGIRVVDRAFELGRALLAAAASPGLREIA
jgi:hypothetical protein